MEIKTPKPVTLVVQDVTVTPDIKFIPKPVTLELLIKELKDGKIS